MWYDKTIAIRDGSSFLECSSVIEHVQICTCTCIVFFALHAFTRMLHIMSIYICTMPVIIVPYIEFMYTYEAICIYKRRVAQLTFQTTKMHTHAAIGTKARYHITYWISDFNDVIYTYSIGMGCTHAVICGGWVVGGGCCTVDKCMALPGNFDKAGALIMKNTMCDTNIACVCRVVFFILPLQLCCTIYFMRNVFTCTHLLGRHGSHIHYILTNCQCNLRVSIGNTICRVFCIFLLHFFTSCFKF